MSSLLWYGTGENDAVDLGNPLTLWQSFKGIGALCGDDPRLDELQSVPGLAEQEVTPWWLAQVGKQAALVLDEYGEKVDGETRRILEVLRDAASETATHEGDETMPDTVTRKAEVEADTPATEEHESHKKPGLIALEDIHDGLHNTMKAIIDHHRNLVEHPDDVAHLDAMEGHIKEMWNANADHHAARYPEEEPLERMDDAEDEKSGTGGEHEPGGQATEVQAKSGLEGATTTGTAPDATTAVATTTARTPARDDRRTAGTTRKGMTPAERTLARLRAENERLIRELAGAE